MIERTVANANPTQLESEIRSIPNFPKTGISVYKRDSDYLVYISPDLTQQQIDDLDLVIANHVPIVPTAEELFSPEKAIGEFYQSLSDQMFNNNVQFGNIGFMVQWKNFAGLKIYANGLLAYGFITQDAYDRFKQIFLNQNINLDDY